MRVLCAGLVLAAANVLPAAVNVGDTYQKVLKEMGRPSGKIEAGSTVSLHYPEKVIKLDRGRVTAIETPPVRESSVELPAPPVAATPERGATARPATAQAGRWTTDYAAALRGAKQLKRRVFLLFTGSDWSSGCMQLQHEILSTAAFRRYASENLMLVEVDFPKRRKLPAELKAQNEELKRQYGINVFPVVVVLDSAGQQLGMLGYMEGGPVAFIDALQKL